MSKLTLLILFATVFNALYMVEVDGQQRSCRESLSYLNRRMFQEIAKCTKELKLTTSREKSAKSNCIMKCVLTKEHIIAPDGSFNERNIVEFVDKEFQKNDGSRIKRVIAPCVKNHGSSLNPSDEYCKSYEPAIKCFGSKLPSLCE